MSQDLQALSWPLASIGEAVELLARRSGLLSTGAPNARPLAPQADLAAAQAGISTEESLGRWIELAAEQLGLEAEPVQVNYTELRFLVGKAGPALLLWPNKAEEVLAAKAPRLLLLLQGNQHSVTLLSPAQTTHRVPTAVVCAALGSAVDEPAHTWIDPLLQDIGVTPARQTRARQAILAELMGAARLNVGWLLRLSPGAAFGHQVRRAGLHWQGIALVAGFLLYQGCQIAAWAFIGQSVLSGHFDQGWLWGWALVLLTGIPLQLWADDAQKTALIHLAALLKQRLLFGVLRLAPEDVRHLGSGQFLGQVLEAQAVEQLALMGGFVTVLATIQLGTAAVVLGFGNGGGWRVLLLLFWLLVAVLLGWLYFRRSEQWIAAYRVMTHDLVERMVGHRTRLAQEDRRHWHDEEDRLLNHYLLLSTGVDQAWTPLGALVTRGWLLIGLSELAYTLFSTHTSLAQLAIRLGGILLAQQAFSQLVAGGQSIVGAVLAWRQVRPLAQAALRAEEVPTPTALALFPASGAIVPPGDGAGEPGKSLILAREISFRYPNQGRTILQACNLQIRQGERLLLAGPSGGGKSTLAALLSGLRRAESGLLLLWGFDRQTLGAATWRQRVVAVPQFHENYVLTETLAFNLLMGRRWPPTPADLAAAEEICLELGLGELLGRMPAGLQQTVGESGWRLSHGERSRLYMARALLQQADLLILDESFAALDPDNLRLALQCVLRRAPTLLVIAHP